MRRKADQTNPSPASARIILSLGASGFSVILDSITKTADCSRPFYLVGLTGFEPVLPP